MNNKHCAIELPFTVGVDHLIKLFFDTWKHIIRSKLAMTRIVPWRFDFNSTHSTMIWKCKRIQAICNKSRSFGGMNRMNATQVQCPYTKQHEFLLQPSLIQCMSAFIYIKRKDLNVSSFCSFSLIPDNDGIVYTRTRSCVLERCAIIIMWSPSMARKAAKSNTGVFTIARINIKK